MLKKIFFIFFSLAFFLLKIAYSQSTPINAEEVRAKAIVQENYDQWKGLGFGMAIGIAVPMKKIIERYEIVNNYLRIAEEKTSIGQILLESHYFFPIRRPIETKYTQAIRTLADDFVASRLQDVDKKRAYYSAVEELDYIRSLRYIGIGPFLCVLPGTDKILKAVGFGIMVGLRRGKSSNSFNIGAGYINYAEMPVLLDGLKEDELLPTEISSPIKQSNSGGILLLFSFTF